MIDHLFENVKIEVFKEVAIWKLLARCDILEKIAE